jgi:hypothetical protein
VLGAFEIDVGSMLDDILLQALDEMAAVFSERNTAGGCPPFGNSRHAIGAFLGLP